MPISSRLLSIPGRSQSSCRLRKKFFACSTKAHNDCWMHSISSRSRTSTTQSVHSQRVHRGYSSRLPTLSVRSFHQPTTLDSAHRSIDASLMPRPVRNLTSSTCTGRTSMSTNLSASTLRLLIGPSRPVACRSAPCVASSRRPSLPASMKRNIRTSLSLRSAINGNARAARQEANSS